MDRADAITYWEGLHKTFSSQLEKEENHFGRMHLQYTLDVLDTTIAALREQEQSNEPLTLDELKKTEGNVWICYPQDVFGPIHPLADNISCTRYKFGFNSYGETWIAYRKPPKEGADHE